MKLTDAIAEFEALFASVEETTIYADDIVEIVTGGLKPEGGTSPALATSEEDAIRLWLSAAKEYKTKHKGDRLIWRIKPDPSAHVFYQLSHASAGGGLDPITLFYKVYSRLAVRKVDHMAAIRDFVRA